MLDELKRLMEEAGGGEWEQNGSVIYCDGGKHLLATISGTCSLSQDRSRAALIVATHNALPDLLAAAEALKKIAYPIEFLQAEARASGETLNGVMAVQLSNDAEWLKGMAREDLARLEGRKG